MYETSLILVPPKRSLQPLWRYLSASRLLDLLQTEELFFSHLPVLEDENEGALTERSRENLAGWFQKQNHCSPQVAHEEVRKYQENRNNFFVNCWHMNDHESYLMWKAYAARGFAVRTTFERVTAALETERPVVTGGVVEYLDFTRDASPVGNVFNHVATKDRPYQDEREFRLVLWDRDPRNAEHPKLSQGMRVPVKISMLVQKVVRSPYPEPMEPELERLLERHELEVQRSAVVVKAN